MLRVERMSAIVMGSSDPIIPVGNAMNFVKPLTIVKDIEKSKCFQPDLVVSASFSMSHVPG